MSGKLLTDVLIPYHVYPADKLQYNLFYPPLPIQTVCPAVYLIRKTSGSGIMLVAVHYYLP